MFERIAQDLNISVNQVQAVVAMLNEGSTVPFISRYRKEKTGGLDEVQITSIRDRAEHYIELESRRNTILKSIDKQEKLTPELEKAINEAETLAELEDIYLPYKPKRKTRASVAKEKGLEPLAKEIYEQKNIDPATTAAEFVDAEKEVADVDAALQGARDIISEWINEDQEARKNIRELYAEEAMISSRVIKGKEAEGAKYKDYFEWEEKLKTTPSHRLLAMRRGEKEMFLTLDIYVTEEQAVNMLEGLILKADNAAAEQVKMAVADAYKRLLKPSIETEFRLESKKNADEEAIKVFAENLRQLLLSAPLGEKRVLALDPGFRTGCKLVCLDEQGKLLYNTAIYPNEPQKQIAQSGAVIKELVTQYKIDAIAIGNGTASRETESFVKSLGLKDVTTVMVNESGASVYSASEVAREEFPNQDLTVRGAVSIGRRLMDPLAELVKIDPKSIGVGQYQHDVDQNALKGGLDDVVVSCVNAVGVEVNTASKQLLSYVSGLGPSLAANIVRFRNEYGAFKDRETLKQVARLGDKAFEQAAGFLRIRNAENPLDQSAVHPERYELVEQMAKDQKCSVKDLINNPELRKSIDLKKYISEDIGLPTLQDIMEELAKPGRDPRQQFEVFSFNEHVHEMKDLQIGMKLPGIVTNITRFGAFVDIGVHQDGLVHVSHLSDQFITDPAEVVKVQQKVDVTVMEVDVERKRISLSMKSDPFGKKPDTKKKAVKKKQQDPEGDFQEKLAQLKGMFGK
ncbi:MAG: Tex family protein [Candidatus Cyclobacteriaceae bacterium M2_1C_046]